MKKLSIITINFNNRDGLRKTIESVVNQTWQDFEYIVIDGGSTDGSVEVIKEFADRIDYWVSEPDKGIYNAMNKGIDQAKGEYSLFLNSGDKLTHWGILENIRHRLASTDLVIGLLRIANSNKIAYRDIAHPITFHTLYQGSLPHPSTFIRSQLCKRLHFDEKYKIVSDWKFFVQAIVIENCTYNIIQDVITEFEEGGISGNLKNCFKERNQILQELFPQRILQDYHTKIYGDTYEDKLYIAIKKHKLHKMFYILNLAIIKTYAIFNKKSRWIKEFPFVI